MGIFSHDLDKIDLDDANFDEDDPEITVHVRLMPWLNSYQQHKSCKIRYQQIINPSSMISNKMVEFVHARR